MSRAKIVDLERKEFLAKEERKSVKDFLTSMLSEEGRRNRTLTNYIEQAREDAPVISLLEELRRLGGVNEFREGIDEIIHKTRTTASAADRLTEKFVFENAEDAQKALEAVKETLDGMAVAYSLDEYPGGFVVSYSRLHTEGGSIRTIKKNIERNVVENPVLNAMTLAAMEAIRQDENDRIVAKRGSWYFDEAYLKKEIDRRENLERVRDLAGTERITKTIEKEAARQEPTRKSYEAPEAAEALNRAKPREGLEAEKIIAAREALNARLMKDYKENFDRYFDTFLTKLQQSGDLKAAERELAKETKNPFVKADALVLAGQRAAEWERLSEANRTLESEKAALTESVEKLTKQNAELAEMLEKMKGVADGLKKERDALDSALKEAKGDIDALTKEKESVERALADALEKIEALESEKAALEGRIETLEGEKTELEKRLTETEKSLKETTEAKETAEKEIETLVKEKAALTKENADLAGRVEALTGEKEALEKTAERLIGEKTELEKRVEDLKGENVTLKELGERLKAEAKEAEEKVKTIAERLEGKEREAGELKEKLEGTERENAGLKEELATIAERIATIEAAFAAANPEAVAETSASLIERLEGIERSIKEGFEKAAQSAAETIDEIAGGEKAEEKVNWDTLVDDIFAEDGEEKEEEDGDDYEQR